ncbi:hypothetical protein GCM10010365_76230 [Streptomyces poonensis]|uniref:Uncharacterized protein n=1 Tax=Streptomyces poonensis TaxID=68255 RepID=A0A918UYX6_9ACTN|nr:hypothetical protein GCM10010365_76230 [Streptomyces poonensis]GLJ93542.1 hypothetical protein GCM10017589_61560 [Streptomyces poonensis]
MVLCLDQGHPALMRWLLSVAQDPEVRADAGGIEELVRQSDDALEPVILNDPSPDVTLARASGSALHRRSTEEDDNAASAVTRGVRRFHLRQHVLEEEQRSVADTRQPCAEASLIAPLILSTDSLLGVSPAKPKRRVRQQVVEVLVAKGVLPQDVPEPNLCRVASATDFGSLG